MKKNSNIRFLIFCIISLISITLSAQKELRAKEILDKTSNTLSKDSGIKATFLLKNYRQHKLTGQTEGSISLKGSRFVLETPGTTTWFNGKTQWTYITENEEINISIPTEEELQNINPYSFINLYKKGFTYKISEHKIYKGKNTYKIILTPEDKKQAISQIELLIEQYSFQPVLIRVNSKKEEETIVEILSYRSKLNIPDNSFTCNEKQYPHAEIIDLR